jgi:ribonuclease P protein component
MKQIVSIKKTREFQKVYNNRVSYANRLLIMYIKENNLDHCRLGISVSKKVGNSVVRHGFSRFVRESYRLNKHLINNNYDIVVIGRANAKDKRYK